MSGEGIRLLAPWASTRPHDRRPTDAWLASLPTDVEIVRHECIGLFDYWAFLDHHWRHPGPLLIVEHDVVPTLADVRALVACPMPACTALYTLIGGNVSLFDLDSRLGLVGSPASWAPTMIGSLWRGGSGLGCVRLDWTVRATIDAGALACRFDVLDAAVSSALRDVGVPWHLHPPVRHTGRDAVAA